MEDTKKDKTLKCPDCSKESDAYNWKKIGFDKYVCQDCYSKTPSAQKSGGVSK